MTTDELHALMKQLYEEQATILRSEWKRSLSFADTVLGNRWSRARRLGFGEGVSIYDSAMVLGEVTIGAKTWVGPGVILDGTGGGLSIGLNCSIAAGVHVYTHDTVLWAVSGGAAPKRLGAVAIGDCCHIGAQSIVLPAVVIGRRCVVAANSVVTRNVPDGQIVGGSPARILGHVEGEGAGARLVLGKSADGAVI